MEIKRYDVANREIEFYPQYYRDKYFTPNPNGRFIKWDELPESIKTLLINPNCEAQDCRNIAEIHLCKNHFEEINHVLKLPEEK